MGTPTTLRAPSPNELPQSLRPPCPRHLFRLVLYRGEKQKTSLPRIIHQRHQTPSPGTPWVPSPGDPLLFPMQRVTGEGQGEGAGAKHETSSRIIRARGVHGAPALMPSEGELFQKSDREAEPVAVWEGMVYTS